MKKPLGPVHLVIDLEHVRMFMMAEENNHPELHFSFFCHFAGENRSHQPGPGERLRCEKKNVTEASRRDRSVLWLVGPSKGTFRPVLSSLIPLLDHSFHSFFI